MAARFFLFKVTQEMRRCFFCDGSSCQIYHSSANQYRSLDRTWECCRQISKSGMRVDPQSCEPQKKPPTFHCTGCLIGILVIVY